MNFNLLSIILKYQLTFLYDIYRILHMLLQNTLIAAYNEKLFLKLKAYFKNRID